MLKLKFIRNQPSLDITNNTQEAFTFDPKEMLGILDLRSLGYYKIRQGVLQQIWVNAIILNQQINYVRNLTY